MRYFNIKTQYGVETVDQIDQNDFVYLADYRQEKLRLLREYRLAGMNVYVSQRACKDWYQK